MNEDRSQVGEIEKLNILSINRLASILGLASSKLAQVARYADMYYAPFETTGRERPFQKEPNKARTIDNPRGDLKRIQRRIYRHLLRPICFPTHILGGIQKRSVLDNAGHHLTTSLLVTIDVRKCFPSITNVQVYRIWRHLLACSPPVASLLTRLTTFRRRLPQGSPASPLLANLLIWLIDEPIRAACVEKDVVYSTWIDDLAFSGTHARDMIQLAVSVLGKCGLRVSRGKIKIMGPNAIKLLTGTRLGRFHVRASRERLWRVRSGIHKLRAGLVPASQQERYVDGLVGQLRYIEHLYAKDSVRYACELAECAKRIQVSSVAKKYFEARCGY